MFYIFLIILLIIYLIYFYRVDLKYRYDINTNNIISTIEVYIWNKSIYHKESKYPIVELLDSYIQDDKKEKEKLSHKLAVLKMNLKILIKDISKEKVHINVFVGANNVIVTSYLLTLISTMASKYFAKNVKHKYINNINYKIIPNYSKILIILDSRIKIRIITIIIIWIKTKIKKTREKGKLV